MNGIRMSIRTKLLGGFGIVLLLTAALGYYAISKMAAIEHDTSAVLEDSAAMEHILKVEVDLVSSGRAEKNAILADDPAEIAKHAASAMKFMELAEESLAELEESDPPASIMTHALALGKIVAEIAHNRGQVLELAKTNRDDDAIKAGTALRVTVDEAEALLDDLDKEAGKIATELEHDAIQTYESARTITIVLIGLALAIGAGIGFWLSRGISQGATAILSRLQSLQEHCLADLKAGMVALAGGDLTVNVTPVTQKIPTSTSDEIGEAVDQTNMIIDGMVATIAAYNESRVALSTTMGEVRNAATALDQQRLDLNTLAGDASQATDAVASGSDQVSRASTEVARAITQVAEGASQQASSVQEVNRSVAQLSSAAMQVAAGAQQQAREVEAIASVSDSVARSAQEMATQAQTAADGARPPRSPLRKAPQPSRRRHPVSTASNRRWKPHRRRWPRWAAAQRRSATSSPSSRTSRRRPTCWR